MNNINKRNIIMSGIFLSISALASTMPIIFFKKLFTELENKFPKESILITILMIILVLLVTEAVLYAISISFAHIGAYSTLMDLRLSLVNRISNLPLGFFQKKRVGELTKVINNDVETYEAFLAHGIPNIISKISVPIIILILVAILDWRMIITMFSLVPILILIFLIFGKRWQEMETKTGHTLAKMSKSLLEYIATITVVKAFSSQETKTKNLHEQIEDYVQWANKQVVTFMFPGGILEILLEGGLVVSLIMGSKFVINGSMTIENFFVIFLLQFTFFQSLFVLFFAFHTTISYKESMNNVNEILSEKELDETDIKEVKIDKYDIEAKNVFFGYNEEEPVIRDISFKIQNKSSVAFIGKSGSGKSTMANLIRRFWSVNQGSIYIGGKNINNLKEEELCKKISIVQQDAFLFNETIEENLKIGKKDATIAEIIEACKKARIHEYIISLPDGYKTIVGERGSTLSGGQRQRITIARAILKDSPIIILDESTSGVDAENEKLINEALTNLCKQKTLIMIAHHLTTITNCDQIFLFDNGKIITKGTHEELMVSSKVYKEMWRTQKEIDNWGFNNLKIINGMEDVPNVGIY
ncbi:MAG: ABC transporter ATP-binding protein [Bacillota bacterium]|nr:ABC transporter ATP-binding protein [Bacillota bacterium]